MKIFFSFLQAMSVGILLSAWVIFFPLSAVAQTTAARGTVSSTETDQTGPEDDLACWTQEDCQKSGGRWDNKNERAQMDCGGSSYGYCYSPPTDLKLGIGLPSGDSFVTSVSDLGDYLNKIYKILLGLSAFIVTLYAMIGGVEYVISGMDKGRMEKGKKRIYGAVTGMILLFLAALLLSTINPRLLSLEVPPFPKMRPLYFLEEGASCEALVEKGYQLENKKEKGLCGEDASKVLEDNAGKDLADRKGNYKTCRWTTCVEKDKKDFTKICLAATGGKYQCFSCMDATASNEALIPSESFCAALTPQPKKGETFGKKLVSCLFSRDHGFTQTAVFDSTFRGECALLVVDCGQIKSCDDYDSQEAVNNDGSEDLDSFEGSSVLPGDYLLPEYCDRNWCGDSVEGFPCQTVIGKIPVVLPGGIAVPFDNVDCTEASP